MAVEGGKNPPQRYLEATIFYFEMEVQICILCVFMRWDQYLGSFSILSEYTL